MRRVSMRGSECAVPLRAPFLLCSLCGHGLQQGAQALPCLPGAHTWHRGDPGLDCCEDLHLLENS